MPPDQAIPTLTLPTEPNSAIFAGHLIADEVKEALISIFTAANTQNPATRSHHLKMAAHHVSDYEEALSELEKSHLGMDQSYRQILDHHLRLLDEPETAENARNASLKELMPLYVHAQFERGQAPDNQLLETVLRAHQGFAASERARGEMHQAGTQRGFSVG
ncbi:MAG: hypothetical protein K2Q12_01145 [Rickettsiales bacterium]|nr:hypothetical protein [Rickettsiales bacterium]